MERELLREMHQRLSGYMEAGLLINRYVVIFGSNESAERIMEFLGEWDIRVDALVDNNPKKDGTKLKGVSVSLPDKLLVPKQDHAVILIASRYYSEMATQLEKMGYQEGVQILKAVEYNTYSITSTAEDEFEKHVKIVRQGEAVYQEICRKFPGIEKLFVCPLGKLGDFYVGLSFLRQYLWEQKIYSFALVVEKKVCVKIAYLFGVDDKTVVIEKSDMEALVQYAVFTDMADQSILIIHHRIPYTCRIGELGNYKGIGFCDHYRYSVFHLKEGSMPEVPNIHKKDKESKEYVQKIFADKELLPQKTAILMPYANTASMLSVSFWEELAKKLWDRGYVVCTNSSGEDEPVIKGTKELFFDIRYGVEMAEEAGVLIGLRSGLCDVLSTAKAKKIILYPDRLYGADSFIKFYSLNRMELCQDASEIVVSDSEPVEEVVEKVLGLMSGL